MLIVVLQLCILGSNYLIWQRISAIEALLINLRNVSVDTSGISPVAMQDMHFKINSIERFIRTTPLVECGNKKDGPTKR